MASLPTHQAYPLPRLGAGHRTREHFSRREELSIDTLTWLNHGKMSIASTPWLSLRSVQVAEQLVRALRGSGFYEKIVWLGPILGLTNAGTYAAPLINVYAVSPTTNATVSNLSEPTGFTQVANGLQIDTMLSSTTVGNSVGIGYWEGGFVDNSPYIPFAEYDNGGMCLGWQWASGGSTFYCRNTAINKYLSASFAGTSGHLYSEYPGSGTDLFTYFNGSLVGQGTSGNLSAVGITPTKLRIHTNIAGFSWRGSCRAAYVTKGGMAAAQVARMHEILYRYLMVPTGRS
jgi:hypothetical protein